MPEEQLIDMQGIGPRCVELLNQVGVQTPEE